MMYFFFLFYGTGLGRHRDSDADIDIDSSNPMSTTFFDIVRHRLKTSFSFTNGSGSHYPERPNPYRTIETRNH